MIKKAFLLLLALLVAAPVLAQSVGVLTIADGRVRLLRGTVTYSLPIGARLEAGDIIATDARGQAQIELDAGVAFNLGPESQLFLADIPARPGAKPIEVALVGGAVKAVAPKGGGAPYRVLLPRLASATDEAIMVLRAAPAADEVFVEAGSAKVSELAADGAAGRNVSARGSDYVSRKGDEAPSLSRPPASFIGGLPRHFLDNLPMRREKFKDAKAEPLRENDTTYAEVGAWLKANPAIRRTFLARYQSRARDAEFRAAVAANIADHPEWERVPGMPKGAAKKTK